MLAKLIAVAIREVRGELAKLDAPQAVRQDPEPLPSSPPETAQPDESRHRYDLGYGAKIVITQEIVDKGTNAVEIVKQKAIAAIESGFSK